MEEPNAMLLAGIAGVKVIKRIGDKNATKKYKDIAVETAWLLWKIRNERIIGERVIKKEEVKERWKNAMKNMIEEELGRTKEKGTKEKRKRNKRISKKMGSERTCDKEKRRKNKDTKVGKRLVEETYLLLK